MSSSQRKLGSIVLWLKKVAATDAPKIKLDPNVRWDDGNVVGLPSHPTRVDTIRIAAQHFHLS